MPCLERREDGVWKEAAALHRTFHVHLQATTCPPAHLLQLYEASAARTLFLRLLTIEPEPVPSIASVLATQGTSTPTHCSHGIPLRSTQLKRDMTPPRRDIHASREDASLIRSRGLAPGSCALESPEASAFPRLQRRHYRLSQPAHFSYLTSKRKHPPSRPRFPIFAIPRVFAPSPFFSLLHRHKKGNMA